MSKIESADYYLSKDVTAPGVTTWAQYTPDALKNSVTGGALSASTAAFSLVMIDLSDAPSGVRIAMRAVDPADPKTDEIFIAGGGLRWFATRGANVSTGYGLGVFSVALENGAESIKIYAEADRR